MNDFSISSKYDIKIRGKYSVFPSTSDEKIPISHNILLIHAFPFDSEVYLGNFTEAELVISLNELGRQFGTIRVILPDLPGFGASESFLEQPHDLGPYVDIIREVVDYFEIETLILGGCSMGGYITLGYLRSYPNSIDGMILIDTKSSADNEEQKANRYKSMELIRTALKKWGKLERTTKMEKVHESIHEIREYIENLHKKVLLNETISTNPDLSETILSIMKKQNPLAIIHALGSMAGRPDNTDTLQRFKKPVLIFVGEKDSLTTVDEATNMKAILHQASLQIIPKAGHLSHTENVAVFNEQFIEWLKHKIFQK